MARRKLGQGGSDSSSPPLAETGFQALGLIGPGENPMALGFPEIEGPKDLVMVDPNQMKLKRARSPPANGKPPSVQPFSSPRSDRGKGPAGRSSEAGRRQLSPSGTSISDPVPRVVGCGKAVAPATERGGSSPQDAVGEAADDQSKGETPVVTSAVAGRQEEPRRGRPGSLGGSLVRCAVGIKEQRSELVPEGDLRSPAPTCSGELLPGSDKAVMRAYNRRTNAQEAASEGVKGAGSSSQGGVVAQLKAALQTGGDGSSPEVGDNQRVAEVQEAVPRASVRQ